MRRIQRLHVHTVPRVIQHSSQVPDHLRVAWLAARRTVHRLHNNLTRGMQHRAMFPEHPRHFSRSAPSSAAYSLPLPCGSRTASSQCPPPLTDTSTRSMPRPPPDKAYPRTTACHPTHLDGSRHQPSPPAQRPSPPGWTHILVPSLCPCHDRFPFPRRTNSRLQKRKVGARGW